MISREEIIGLSVLLGSLMLVGGVVLAGFWVAKEDQECKSIPDKIVVPYNWQNNQTLVDQFNKCCDRGTAYDETHNTLWCFG